MRKTYVKKWPRKNLGEMLNFLETMHPEGLRLDVLAKKMECTVNNVSAVFLKDDMKLSKAEAIARLYGYELKLLFPVREFNPGEKVPEPKKKYENAGNLSGLARYISDNEYRLTMVSFASKCNEQVISRALTNGDILISTLYKIIEGLDISVIWRFEKIK